MDKFVELPAQNRERERAGACRAYFITFCCYGAHLPGQDNIVDDRYNAFGAPLFDHHSSWLQYSKQVMCEEPYLLDAPRRQVVLQRVTRLCECRQWSLLALHVRTTHVHLVVGAATEKNTTPEQMMTAIKAASSAGLNQCKVDPPVRRRRWARHGSTRYLWTREDVSASIHYVLVNQGKPLTVYAG